ncbi:hypothetical protein FKP32DRAFT_1597129 [Trametes sanguinea]|nr:hypothetical protein FKP32DRAFT_1597129 [Trametes sanguinea]
MPITFLPIAPGFDFRHSQDWAQLADRVADWLIAVVDDPRSRVWRWGREVFWIAFVGAYPRFPGGEWPNWPCKISLDGAFITHWMNRQHGLTCEGTSEVDGDYGPPSVEVAEPEEEIPVYHDVHAELWARLQQHLSVLHSM